MDGWGSVELIWMVGAVLSLYGCIIFSAHIDLTCIHLMFLFSMLGGYRVCVLVTTLWYIYFFGIIMENFKM